MIAWGDVATWVAMAATVGIHVVLYNRRAAAKRPRVVFSHELIPAPTLKGFRRIDGVKVRVVNIGGSPSFVQAAIWERDGQPIRDALPDLVGTSRERSSFVKIEPGDYLEFVTQGFEGGLGTEINEIRVIDLEHHAHVHTFQLVPARGYIAVFPGDWPPAYDVQSFETLSGHECV